MISIRGLLRIVNFEPAAGMLENDTIYIPANLAFGTGFGTFRDVFPLYRQGECGLYGRLVMAHNSYLDGFLGLGLPFLVFLAAGLAALAVILTIGYRDRRRYREFRRQLRAKHAGLYARRGALARESAMNPAERALYRFYWGPRPMPAAVEDALYRRIFRPRDQ